MLSPLVDWTKVLMAKAQDCSRLVKDPAKVPEQRLSYEADKDVSVEPCK